MLCMYTNTVMITLAKIWNTILRSADYCICHSRWSSQLIPWPGTSKPNLMATVLWLGLAWFLICGQSSLVGLCVQGNKSLCAAVTISATLVNIQTHSDLVRGEMTTVCVCVCYGSWWIENTGWMQRCWGPASSKKQLRRWWNGWGRWMRR